MSRDFDEIRKLASLPIDTVPLCLAADLVDEIAQLEAQLAEVKPPTSLGDVSPKRAIAEQIAALQEQMRESTVDFRLRALPAHGPQTWSKLWARMPVRGENENDDDWNDRLFPFYAEMVSHSCYDPVMTVEQVTELASLLHHRAWNKLVTGCIALNGSEVDVPNSDAASELTRDSEQT